MFVKFDPERHHRGSIRLKGYDYRGAGAYFVTIVTQDRECLLGEIVEDAMRLNDAGRMVEWGRFRGRLWQRNYYEHVIRNEESLWRIRRYIADNPLHWALDRENVLAVRPRSENPWQA